MKLDLSQTPPLVQEDDGTVRVVGHRVTLDTLVSEFRDGATPEQIQDSFPSLSLSEIYGVIAFYLDHRADVEDYLRERASEAAATRATVEGRQGTDVRERFRARRAEHASS
jgi:uncharacterized protein (DUF433 family)